MLAGIANGGAKSMVRVQGYHDRVASSKPLDMGADGMLVPHINIRRSRQAASLRPLSDRWDAIGLLPVTQHEPGRSARLRR
jgi:hypothetical protein